MRSKIGANSARQRPPVHVGEDLDPARAHLLDGAFHLLQALGHVVHRQRRDPAGKALRMRRADLGHAVVGEARELGDLSGGASASSVGSERVRICW
jgi:hypothetical protein